MLSVYLGCETSDSFSLLEKEVTAKRLQMLVKLSFDMLALELNKIAIFSGVVHE